MPKKELKVVAEALRPAFVGNSELQYKVRELAFRTTEELVLLQKKNGQFILNGKKATLKQQCIMTATLLEYVSRRGSIHYVFGAYSQDSIKSFVASAQLSVGYLTGLIFKKAKDHDCVKVKHAIDDTALVLFALSAYARMQINERFQPLSIFVLDKDKTILTVCERLAAYLYHMRVNKTWATDNLANVYSALLSWTNTSRLAWAHLGTDSNATESYKNRKLVYKSLIASFKQTPLDTSVMKPIILALQHVKDDELNAYVEPLKLQLKSLLKEKPGLSNYIAVANYYASLFNESMAPLARLFDKIETRFEKTYTNVEKLEYALPNLIGWAQFSSYGAISFYKKTKLEDAAKAKETKPSKVKSKKAKPPSS